MEKYAPIVEISTDKVDTEVPAPVSGVILRIVHPEGTTVRAGTMIAVIGQPGETVAGIAAEAEARSVAVKPLEGAPLRRCPPRVRRNCAISGVFRRWSAASRASMPSI